MYNFFMINKERLSIIFIGLFLTLNVGFVYISYSNTNKAEKLYFEIINTFPHDTSAFTQGLIYKNGYLYESTGLYGKSGIRKVDIASGTILIKRDIPKQFFGEGITIFNGKIYQITWKSNTGFIYKEDDFSFN